MILLTQIPISITSSPTSSMHKMIKKNLEDSLSMIKNHGSKIQIPSKKWILSGCKHPRTSSFDMDDNPKAPPFSMGDKKNNNKEDVEATLADIDRFLFENFKSLYIKDDEEIDHNNHKVYYTKRVSHEEEGHDHDIAPKLGHPVLFKGPPLDLYDSNRFNMKRDSSGSLLETTIDDEGGSNSPTITINEFSSSNSYHLKDQDMDQTCPNNCVVVLACSPDPYEDFKQSMQGMVEARLRNHEMVDWEFIEQLLFCHMNLNEKKSYKFILNAFVDLVTDMRPHWETPRAATMPHSVRTVRKKNK